ncbi:hypothetical protein B0H14DRAFT_3448995 [Mycena olivaceomarginata]|nr:hypothetical protein B0H14DRAFT_3448995 [Mycena olivaceomarginata]
MLYPLPVPVPPRPPPAPAPPRVIRASAALATPFRPASTCAAPHTPVGTPVSLCAHRTVVSFAASGAYAPDSATPCGSGAGWG